MALAFTSAVVAAEDAKTIRVGIIGLDTSHATAFTQMLNAAKPRPEFANCRVVAAYPQGSRDIESSVKRVPEYREIVKKLGVEIVDSIETLVEKVDVVLLESNDGRPHLEQLRPCLKAKKPVFIDKPVAGSLTDAIRIYREAEAAGVPIFSSSGLRYGKNTQAVRHGSIGIVRKAETTSPASLEPTHPDLFWYGIHGVESLYTLMGRGCVTVQRGKTAEGKIEVIGTWDNGRIGIYREGTGYVGHATGEKGETDAGAFDGYEPLLATIVQFFRDQKPPVAAEETLELYTFMEAADESKRQNGAVVRLADVRAQAEKAVP